MKRIHREIIKCQISRQDILKYAHHKFLFELTDGFGLLETIFSVAITSLILTSSLAVYISCLHFSDQMTTKSFELDDSWVVYHAMANDMHCASSYSYDNSIISISEQGQVMDYQLSPSQMIYRSVNGNGTAIVSTNVENVNYQVLPKTGVVVNVYYGQDSPTLNTKYSLVFSLGHIN